MDVAWFLALCWLDLLLLILTIHSIVGVMYSTKMVFRILKPHDHSNGPLHDRAISFIKYQPGLMLARRGYALEAWLSGPIAGAGLGTLPLIILLTISWFPW